MRPRGDKPISPEVFTLPSFAKINWSLRILGKRPDDYHEIRTVLQTVSLHDNIRFAANQAPDILFSCDDPLIPTNENNLIVRAANALRSRYGITVGARIDLEKRIPAKGGLGGGSSNAAVALLGLAHLWKLTTNSSELVKLAAAIGADVPFFLHGGRALGTGIGTTIASLPDLHAQLLIVAPSASVATAEAYKAFSSAALTTQNPDSILAVSHEATDSADWDQWPHLDDLENDFEQVIFDIEPQIRRAKNSLLQVGARGVSLAGSGSSVFGIFDNREDQQRAVEQIRAENGWRIFPCVTLSREEYLRALGSCGTPLLRSFDLRFDSGA